MTIAIYRAEELELVGLLGSQISGPSVSDLGQFEMVKSC